MTDAGTTVLQDSTQPPYDGVEDTLIGVVNTASRSLTSLALSSNTDLFGFDGDGLCAATPRPAGCPFGPTGYEGPNTSFSGITANASGGVVNFDPPLGFGETAYFSLEEALSATQVFSGGPGVREAGGAPNPSEHVTTCFSKDPVNCATGQLVEGYTDASVPGRGVPLGFERTYSSGGAAADGRLGFGWTDNYAMALSVDPSGNVTVIQENGSTVDFINAGGGSFIAPPRVLATLEQHGDGSYSFTRKTTNVRYDFSASGRLVSEVDRNGYATTLSYTGDQLTAVTDPAARSLTFTYAGSHLSAIKDPMGRTVTYGYDTSGNLITATDAAGRTQTFTYDQRHFLLTITDHRGGVTSITYDGSGRVSSQTDPVGLKQTFAYSGDPVGSAGGKTTLTDTHGNITAYEYANLELLSVTHGESTPAAAKTSYTYDPATLGLTTITDPLGHVTTNTFDGDGNLLTTTDPAGHTSRFTYNGFDELTSRTAPLGETTTFAYDGQGNLQAVTDPLGNTTTLAYADSAHPGDLTLITDPDGRVTTRTYDGFGNLASRGVSPHSGTIFTTKMVYDSDGERTCQVAATANAAGVDCPPAGSPHAPNTLSWEYDAVGQVVAVTDPNGGRTTHEYDSNGNRTKTTDPDGDVTTTTYDGLDRPTATSRGATAATPSTTRFAYDLAPGTGACGTDVAGATYCSTVTDPNGHVTVDFFSARDQLLAETRPGNKTTSHSYDLAGNEQSRTDPAGRTVTIAYDATDRVTSLNYSEGDTHNVSYDYDADGRRTAMSDGTGTSSYTYDADGRYRAVTNGAGATISYGYDGAGNITTLTYPNGEAVTRSFDGAGQMASVTDWLGHTTNFGYDPNGNQTTTTYPNGDTVSSSFDATDRMTGTKLSDSSSTLATISYARDPAGRITKETDGGALTGTTAYLYDAKRQLTDVNGSNYDYDLAGNPTKLADGINQAFDAADQLTSSTGPDGTTTYIFNGVGDRTSATSHGVTTKYGYDQASRLTTVTQPTLPPAITAITPTRGPVSGGTPITITGNGFTGATSVTVGGKDASFTVNSDSSISATTPPGTGTVDVVVTTDAGSSLTSAAAQFTYVPTRRTPIVTAVAPGYGPQHGGVTVTITGTRFTGATAVQFGTKRARFHVESANRIVARAPSGSGTVHVRVTTPKGRSAARPTDRFTYVAGPGIYALKPVSGPANGGTKVSIIGFNLRHATNVRFGTHKARFVLDRDGDRIIASSPSGTGTVHVRVATRNGTSPIVSGDQYTYIGHAVTGASTRPAAAAAPKTLATYAYDGDGLRSSKMTANGTSLFTWDISQPVPLILDDGQQRLLYGPGGLPVEQVDAAGAVLYFVHDNLGSTRALLDGAGIVKATFSYSAFGKVTQTGTARTSILFAGSFRDEETGLYYLVHRYYDPGTAEFLTVDPAANFTLSAYVYLNGDPVNWADPLGLWPSLGTVLGAVSTVTGAVAIGLAVTGVGAPAAAVLEGVSVLSGIGAAVLDCREAVDVQCGVDVAAAVLGTAGVAVRGLSLAGQIARDTAEVTDLFLSIHAVHLGFAGTVIGLFKESGKEPETPHQEALAC